MVDCFNIQEVVLDLLSGRHLRLTPSDLSRAVRQEIPPTRSSAIRTAIRDMISRGYIIYTQYNSTTHLEINYRRPVQISDRITLLPWNSSIESEPNQISIKLHDGIAFGAGDHPTTRMMLRGLDYLISPEGSDRGFIMDRALDIGTGNGVLAIAAAKLGIQGVDAIDIDPAACHEAEKNAELNSSLNRINFYTKGLDQFPKSCYDLILANLRPPTLKEIIPEILNLSSPYAIWLLSGCRADELERIKNNLPNAYSKVIWQEEEAEWSSFAVISRHGN